MQLIKSNQLNTSKKKKRKKINSNTKLFEIFWGALTRIRSTRCIFDSDVTVVVSQTRVRSLNSTSDLRAWNNNWSRSSTAYTHSHIRNETRPCDSYWCSRTSTVFTFAFFFFFFSQVLSSNFWGNKNMFANQQLNFLIVLPCWWNACDNGKIWGSWRWRWIPTKVFNCLWTVHSCSEKKIFFIFGVFVWCVK